ncbi:MAG: hypothetical protein AAF657_03935 [Acidobacteriota bacterium]
MPEINHKTNLSINCKLTKNKKPKIDTSSSSSVKITPEATTITITDGTAGPPVDQPHSPTSNPYLQLYDNSNNTVQWTLPSYTKGISDWRTSTNIVGVVIEAPLAPDIINHPGGLGLGLPSTAVGESYEPSPWAGPSGLEGGSTRPFLYLFSGNTGALQVQQDLFFSIDASGERSKIQPRTIDGPTEQTYFPFNYRIYFYSPSVGVWWDDPTVDLDPFSIDHR